MTIISWNVNGIRAVHKKGLFVPFIDQYQPDVLCLQETKAFEHQHEVDLPGYEEYWNSAEKPGYSGTAIFTKHKPLSVAFGIPENIAAKYGLVADAYGDPNKEGRVTVVEFENLYVCSVYTPNAKDDLSRIPLRQHQWDPAFLEYMKTLDQKKPVVFCGDLNVAHTEDDLARPKPNVGKKGFTTEERQGIDTVVKAGFVDTFRMFTQGNGHYTWWTQWGNARANNVGWRIDYLFASERLRPHIQSSSILAEVFGSDHCPVMLELDA